MILKREMFLEIGLSYDADLQINLICQNIPMQEMLDGIL